MPIIASKLNINTPEYYANFAQMQQFVQDLNEKLVNIRQGGDEKAKIQHQKRGKLLVRDRIQALLDPGSPFLELAAFAGYELYDGSAVCGGIVAGVGYVQGREIMIVANDATVKGGAYYPITGKKHLRAQEIATENRLPCVYLVDSGGAFLPMQDEVFPDRDHFGRVFYNQAHMSEQNIPQIAVVMGLCTAGGAYVPAMCDETIIVKNQGAIYLAGPLLVEAAIGEQIDAESLGGGDTHTRLSGVADHLADNDGHALQIAREILAHCPRDAYSLPRQMAMPPHYAMNEIYGVIPTDRRLPFDVREIIARLVDSSIFHEFKALYGKTLVCGFAHIDGWHVGIIANNGILLSESSLKGAHFIQLCEQRGIPIIFLQNITGFMVGKQAEHGGIAKNGAKLVKAVACAKVPKFTVVIGGSFGAGNYAMAGRAYQPRWLWMWPNARIGVMGGEQAAFVLTGVRKAAYQKRGKPWTVEAEAAYKAEISEKFHAQAHPYYASARLWDDGVIDPLETRAVLSMALASAANAPLQKSTSGVYRM